MWTPNVDEQRLVKPFVDLHKGQHILFTEFFCDAKEKLGDAHGYVLRGHLVAVIIEI